MRSPITILLLSLTIQASLCSCGEDRTHEYEELTQANHAMYDFMKEVYLWNDNMDELEWNKFFGNGDDFFDKITLKGDKWSFVTIDTLQSDPHAKGYFNHFNSYGLNFSLVTDPTGKTNRQLFRVNMVVDGSPAAEAGLQRNDFISTIDGSRAGSSLTDKLSKGGERSLSVLRIHVDDETGELEWKDTTNVTLHASTYVEDVPFPSYGIVETAAGKTAYLLCMRLTEGPWEKDSTSNAYNEELDQIFTYFHSENVQQLVLDLRYCNDGSISMAQKMASYIVGDDYHDQAFLTTFWNAEQSGNDELIPFDQSLCHGHALGLPRIAVLTSSMTQGAAEWLIHGLQAALGEEQVFVIGKATAGCCVMTTAFHMSDHITIHPAVAYVADGNGDFGYSGGITPTSSVEETNYYLTSYPLGDPREVLFNAALDALRQ